MSFELRVRRLGFVLNKEGPLWVVFFSILGCLTSKAILFYNPVKYIGIGES